MTTVCPPLSSKSSFPTPLNDSDNKTSPTTIVVVISRPPTISLPHIVNDDKATSPLLPPPHDATTRPPLLQLIVVFFHLPLYPNFLHMRLTIASVNDAHPSPSIRPLTPISTQSAGPSCPTRTLPPLFLLLRKVTEQEEQERCPLSCWPSSPVADPGTDGIDFRRRDRNPRQQQQQQQQKQQQQQQQRVLEQAGEASRGREDKQ